MENNTLNRIGEFFGTYGNHLNAVLAASPSQHTFTDKVMEFGPLGIVNEEHTPGSMIALVSSDIHPLDDDHAIAKIQWRYNDSANADFHVFYLVKANEPDVRIFASVTGDEAGLQEHGLRSLYKLYLHEKKKAMVRKPAAVFSFTAN